MYEHSSVVAAMEKDIVNGYDSDNVTFIRKGEKFPS